MEQQDEVNDQWILFIRDFQEPCFFLFMLLQLFCMMFLMQYARLVVSLRLSLASSMLKMKLVVLKYLIVYVVFFFQMFDCVCGCIFFISSIIYVSNCPLEFALYVPFFLCMLVHNLITALFTLKCGCMHVTLFDIVHVVLIM